MAFELIAAVVFGFGTAGIAMLLRKIAPSLIPRFVVPASAGLAMLGFTIWSEYAWFDRQASSLPAGVEVATTAATASPLRPWTYVRPFVNRFIAVDVGGAKRHEKAPGQVLVDLYVFERYAPTARVPLLVDCAAARRADIADGAVFKDDGAFADVVWREVGAEDPLVRTACAAG